TCRPRRNWQRLDLPPDRRAVEAGSAPALHSKCSLREMGQRRREMNRMKFLAGLCLTAFLAAVPAFAQTDAKPKEPPKPALTGSAAILEQWNDIGRKLIAIAEDFPEDKYDYKPHPDSRTFVGNLLHVSASMYFFTDTAQG